MKLMNLFNVKVMILLSILLNMCILSANPAEIIDTLYVENSLQGGFGYHIEADYFMGGIAPPNTEVYYVGDGYDQFDFSNVSMRSYLSIPIDSIPNNYHIESATLYLHQRFSTGNGGQNNFPIWYNGSDYPCMVAHVDYGDTLDNTDFYTSVLSDLGIISDNNTIGWHTLDITNAYIADVIANKQYCQLMLYFHILSDYDNNADWVGFDNSHTHYSGCKPQLVVHYANNTEVNENNYYISRVSIYPNPVETNLYIKLSDGSNLIKTQIYNLKGQQIKINSFARKSNNEYNLDFSRGKLKSGLYILKCSYSLHGRICSEMKKIILQ